MKFGIDISEHQKGINFDEILAEGVEYIIIRASYGTREDYQFKTFYDECKKRNIPVGAYLFSTAMSIEGAKHEAKYLANRLNGLKFEYPIYYDFERKSQLGLGKKTVTDMIVSFCEEMQNNGYYVGVYSYLSGFYSMDLDRLEPYCKWIAQYNTKCDYKRDYGMWQFGGEVNLIRSNKIAGYVCDQDYCYIDYPSIIKQGYNGYQSTDLTEVARQVILGAWGNGESRKQALEANGYDYEKVQAKVNELLNAKVKTNEDIAKEVIEGKWGNMPVRKNKLISAGYDYEEIQKLVNDMMKNKR
jgi:hypothetical protein